MNIIVASILILLFPEEELIKGISYEE